MALQSQLGAEKPGVAVVGVEVGGGRGALRVEVGRHGVGRYTTRLASSCDHGRTSTYHLLMAIKAQLLSAESMRIDRSNRATDTAIACPICHSYPAESCRDLLSAPGVDPVRVGGYLSTVHPERWVDRAIPAPR